MALALNIGKCTLLGNYRENNEDSIDVKQFPDMTVCLVADGMGGQAAGEVARMKSIAQGAATSVWSGIVASADAVGGRYCEDCHLAEITPNDPSVHGGVLA